MRNLKKAVVAVSILGTGLAAHAQTSLTIYGRVVAGVDYESNIAKANGTTGGVARLATNQWGTSMLGFKGEEDLGGALKSLFLLETGFGTAKGEGNGPEMFNRRAYVGLSTPTLGTIKLGKDLSISNDVWNLDPTGQQWMSTATLVKGRNWEGTSHGMIEYESPNWGGFSTTLQTAFGGQPGFNKLRKDAITLDYVKPTYEIRAIYDVARDVDGRYTELFSASKEFTIGGTVTIDKLKLLAGYENLRAPDAPTGAPNKADHYWLGANYQVTPATTLIGAAYHIKENNQGGSANLYMVGANYALSKRTLLYVSVGTVRNSGNANFSVEIDNTPPAGQSQNSTYFGIAHSF